ncbi:hypothetical protein [Nitrospirillum amazonense]|nr:hypothetical protein [Nitrospirillum amazonense]
MTAQRPELLRLLVTGVHQLTVCARTHYSEPDALDRMRDINEAIHVLSGHLRDLFNENGPLTESRADGIVAALRLLGPS